MCNNDAPKAPKPRDFEAERLAAELAATEKSNAELAAQKRKRSKSSLIANAGGAGGVSAISQPVGKDTLG